MAKYILVVDDAAEVRDLIQAMLEAHGYKVVTAIDGLDAIEKIKESEPSLILSDVLMPNMDGFELFKTLREDEDLKKIPFIVLTVRSKMEDSFKAVGVDSFLAKPIDSNALLQTVEKHLKMEKLADKVDELREKAGFRDENSRRKVLLFGDNQDVLRSMSEQLEKENCCAMVILDEKQIVSTVSMIEPELILLQLKGQTLIPIDQIVFSLSNLIREKSEKFKGKIYNPNIVLYKVEDEEGAIGSLGENIADTESLVERCYDSGDAKYIGLYSAISFIMKIKVFLN